MCSLFTKKEKKDVKSKIKENISKNIFFYFIKKKKKQKIDKNSL